MPPLWQTESWERFQKALCHHCERVEGNLLLLHPLFFGFHYGYIPRGPTDGSEHGIRALLDAVEPHRQKYKLIFLRMDPIQALTLPKNVRAEPSTSIQPETTLIIDLTKIEEEIRAQMKRKGRYNSDLAKKKGVVVKKASGTCERSQYCDLFYDLLMETGERDGFFIHDRHYQTMLKTIPEAEIFVAFYGKETMAAGIFVFLPERAYYYYGASSREKKEFMAPYLLQWEAIREAKSRGCRTYDFLGIAPPDAPKTHPWKGITEFKLKFGGTVIQYPKPVDIVYHPFWYRVYRILKWIQEKIKK
jgi:lipid II:glycine glycyltransferase (peptidoglycan interpeptide bridge formation enzyme)